MKVRMKYTKQKIIYYRIIINYSTIILLINIHITINI